jgi:protein-tyrosine phosphatase
LAAAVLVDGAARRGIDLVATSAGVTVPMPMPATAPVAAVARAMGLDVAGHRSRSVTRALVTHADLVLGMERRHVQEVVLLDPGAFPKTFSLKELVRRGAAVGPRADGEDVAAWLGRVHAGRRALDLLGSSPADDIADPTGNALADHRSTGDEIADLVDALLDLLYPGV